jgi:hypothetical protein
MVALPAALQTHGSLDPDNAANQETENIGRSSTKLWKSQILKFADFNANLRNLGLADLKKRFARPPLINFIPPPPQTVGVFLI